MRLELLMYEGEAYLEIDFPFAKLLYLFKNQDPTDAWLVHFDESNEPHPVRRVDIVSELRRAASILTTLELLDDLKQVKE